MTLILNNNRPKTNNSEWEQTLQTQAESLCNELNEWLVLQNKSISDLSNPQIYMALIDLIRDENTPAQQGIKPLQRAVVQASFEAITFNLIQGNTMTNTRHEEPVMVPGLSPEQPNRPNPQRQRRPRIEEPILMPVPIEKPKKS